MIRRSGFTLLEVLLVMVIIGVLAALVMPSLDGAFANYQIERSGEDLQIRLAQIRIEAMERGIPYAFAYRPDTDEFISWACEPLTQSPTGGAGIFASTNSALPETQDIYDRRYFKLNSQGDDEAEFYFLGEDLEAALEASGLSSDVRGQIGSVTSGQAIGASELLSQRKFSMVYTSARSIAALQIPGLQYGEITEPIVFEADGTIDRDAVIRIADRRDSYVEIQVQGISGSIRASRRKALQDLAGAQVITTTQSQGFRRANQSRETTPNRS